MKETLNQLIVFFEEMAQRRRDWAHEADGQDQTIFNVAVGLGYDLAAGRIRQLILTMENQEEQEREASPE